MKLLLDTCALVWSLEDNSCLLPEARQQISDRSNEVFVSAASTAPRKSKVKSQKCYKSSLLVV